MRSVKKVKRNLDAPNPLTLSKCLYRLPDTNPTAMPCGPASRPKDNFHINFKPPKKGNQPAGGEPSVAAVYES
jgi:hypothetical protein